MLNHKSKLVPDSDTKVKINGLTITMNQVLQFAPIIPLCDNEPHMFCLIEYNLSHSTLLRESKPEEPDPNFAIKHPSQKDLLQYYQENYYLDIEPTSFSVSLWIRYQICNDPSLL
jgi:hypothetical protein